MQIKVLRDVLEQDSEFADRIRDDLARRGILALNLISAPGAGKTSLLERTLERLAGRLRVAVIEGDIATSLDAERVSREGVEVIQLNTGGACHLEARLVIRGYEALDLAGVDLLLIENVGNIACPAEFDLGEDAKVALVSVAEGHDKPAKYPLLFHEAGCFVLNKIDLAPYVDFDRDLFMRALRGLNQDAPVLQVSCRTGEGIDTWIAWIEEALRAKREGRLPLPSFAHRHEHGDAGGHGHAHGQHTHPH